MKILIIGPSWVGDMIMAQSLFIALQDQHPDCVIDVLAPEWCRAVLSRMPQVNEALALTIGHGELAISKRRAIGHSLRSKGYDQAIVLPNSFKSALIPWFANIKLRTGFRGEARGWLLNDCRILNKARYPLMVQRFAALAWPDQTPLPENLPFPALKAETNAGLELRQRLQVLSDKPIAVLCPGAEFGPAKQWPARHYAGLAETLIKQGKQIWILGSQKDREVAQQIRNLLKNTEQDFCFDLCGSTSLGEVIDLLALAEVVISNDSGLMHIAAALARPVVVLYGSTSAAFTPPLSKKAKLISLDLPCSPCFKRECPLQHLDCLNKLEPQRVYLAINELLA